MQKNLKSVMASQTTDSTVKEAAISVDESLGNAVNIINPSDNAPRVNEKFAGLRAINPDITGWISIQGTGIDYPVVTDNDDSDFYLSHSFYKDDDRHGSLYVKSFASLGSDTNTVIYGHSMKDGTMFGSLKKFRNKDYLDEHKSIVIETEDDTVTYDIVAAFDSKVYKSDDTCFKYYRFYNAGSEDEFKEYVDNIKKLNIYDDFDAQYGDSFITLSTCSGRNSTARFVVVGINRSQAMQQASIR